MEALHKHLLEMRLEDVLGREVLEVMTDPQEQRLNLIFYFSILAVFRVRIG